MNGKQRFEEQGFKLTLSSEFSDIFEKFIETTNEKVSVVFDKKALQVLVSATIDGEEVASFMPSDFYVAIFKHCADLGW
jgi:Fe-S cluster assembly iron-binding protein IscA